MALLVQCSIPVLFLPYFALILAGFDLASAGTRVIT